MGGPHVTEVPGEAIGRDSEPRHADAVALGEVDDIWPQIIQDAEQGNLQETYRSADAAGREVKPSLEDYPQIPWEKMDLEQFNLIHKIPSWGRYLMKRGGCEGLEQPLRPSRRIRSRLSVRLRFLHGDRLFWEVHPVSDGPERGG